MNPSRRGQPTDRSALRVWTDDEISGRRDPELSRRTHQFRLTCMRILHAEKNNTSTKSLIPSNESVFFSSRVPRCHGEACEANNTCCSPGDRYRRDDPEFVVVEAWAKLSPRTNLSNPRATWRPNEVPVKKTETVPLVKANPSTWKLDK